MRYLVMAALLLVGGCDRAHAEEKIEEFVFPELVIRASPPPAKKKPPIASVKKHRRAPRAYGQ